VDRSASDQEIKTGYRKMAMKHHPDKGGDPETFKKVNQAHEVSASILKKNV
jgi:DnaJ family protein A protein 2